ncbi:MAG: carboxypeptidase-like regulatory domain-containing protein, partial [Planctomycetota bacterium]
LPIGEPGLRGKPGVDHRGYDLSIEAKGYPPQPLHACEVHEGQEQRIGIRLRAARSIAVTVTVRDDLGAPVQGAKVEALGERDVEVSTDANGCGVVRLAAASKLGLSASHVGYRSAQRWLEPEAEAVALQTTLTLARVRPLDGQVKDQFGAPAAGMSLHVEDRIVGQSDVEGRFHVDEFPLGPRKFLVVSGSEMDPIQWTGEQSPETVDAEMGPVSIVLQRRPGSVAVRVAVVGAATGEALELSDARLFLYLDAPGGYFLQKRTQAGRGFVTSAATPAGRWRLDVVTATGHRGSLPFELIEGQPPTELRLELPLPGTITGRLRFQGVAPPSNAILSVRHAAIDRSAFVQFHYPGRWHLDAATQTVADNQFGSTGSLRMQPVANPTFTLASADPTDELIFTVRGDGIAGEATVRVQPGRSCEVVVEVGPKPPR